MRHRPSFESFAELARDHTLVPVYRRLVADALTPVLAYWRLHDGQPAFLFESVVGGERVGRFSFVGAGPFLRFEASGHRVRIQHGDEPAVESVEADPLKTLEHLIATYRAPNLPGLPRFTGGAVGYAGYDTVRYVERLPNAPPDDRHLPDLRFAFYDQMVIFDHITKTVTAVALAHGGGSPPFAKGGLRPAYDLACHRVDDLVTKLGRPADLPPTDIDPAPNEALTIQYQSNLPPGGYQDAVRKA